MPPGDVGPPDGVVCLKRLDIANMILQVGRPPPFDPVEGASGRSRSVRIFRWDLDKTYLLTDFDSFVGLVRSATEPASAKEAVPGAPSLLRGLSAADDCLIYFVSGSPTQLREVLEEKLRLDGIRYERLTLKDNLSNLRRGRVRAIRGQFGYKLPQLLRDRVGVGWATRETLFGDDAEIDAIVYCAYADAVSGRLEPAQLARVMRVAGAYPDDTEAALDALSQISTSEVSERIFIRLERRRPVADFAPLGSRVFPVHSWWQAAVVLVADGDLPASEAVAVAQDVFGGLDGAAWRVASDTQDVVRRGGANAEHVDAIALPAAWKELTMRSLKHLGGPAPSQKRGPPDDLPDYSAIIQGWH